MSNAKRRQRRRRRNKLASEWWHLVVHGRLVKLPPELKFMHRNPFLVQALSNSDPRIVAELYPEAPQSPQKGRVPGSRVTGIDGAKAEA